MNKTAFCSSLQLSHPRTPSGCKRISWFTAERLLTSLAFAVQDVSDITYSSCIIIIPEVMLVRCSGGLRHGELHSLQVCRGCLMRLHGRSDPCALGLFGPCSPKDITKDDTYGNGQLTIFIVALRTIGERSGERRESGVCDFFGCFLSEADHSAYFLFLFLMVDVSRENEERCGMSSVSLSFCCI